MDSEKKKLKQEYIRLKGKFERLLRRYAPIDPSDEYSDIDDYESLVPSLVSMVIRGCGREELARAIAAFRSNHWSKVPSNPELEGKMADAVLKAYLAKGKEDDWKPRKQTKPRLTLDLRKDREDVFDYFKTQVQIFVQDVEAGKRCGTLVYRVECGYQYSQAGWVMIYFDTRPDASADGHWTLFIDKRIMKRTHWQKASSANMQGSVCVVDHEGVERLISEDDEIGMSQAIGLMLKAELLRARDEGVFLPLPLAPTCTLGVEDFDGSFGWPLDGGLDDDAFVTQASRPG